MLNCCNDEIITNYSVVELLLDINEKPLINFFC